MTNRRFYILAGVLLLGVAASAMLGSLDHPFTAGETRHLKLAFSQYPLSIGQWKGEDRALSEREVSIAGMDEYLLRTYRHADGRVVSFYLCYYGNKLRGMESIYHSPTICFPAAGYEIASSERRRVKLLDAARQFEVSLDRFRKSGSELLVLNFFVIDGEILEKTPRNKPFYLALEKLKLSEDPGYFVQVQVIAPFRGGGDDPTATAIAFLEEAGRHIFVHF